MKTARLLLAALCLAACQPAADGTATETPVDQGVAVTALEGETTPSAIVALDPEGLRLVDAATGSTRLLPFGAPMAETVPALSAVLGEAVEAGDMTECGPGPLHYTAFDGGLRLWFSAGAFAGWESTGGLTTMNGLSADANREEVEAAGVTQFVRDTLDDEFDLGGVYGVMEADGQEVALLHVGANCFMR